jgi:hypothetical protein
MRFQDVFQYPEDVNTKHLHDIIINTVYFCINGVRGYPNLDKLGRTLPNDIKSDFSNSIYAVPLRMDRSIKSELPWKWSEATGKYVGCQFWSIKAKYLFDDEVRKHFGEEATLEQACKLAKCLSGRYIEHEHVFPRKEFNRLLNNEKLTITNLQQFFSIYAVGCVVLTSEHSQIRTEEGDETNPWKRYSRNHFIPLADNIRWASDHRKMIEEAGLLQ